MACAMLGRTPDVSRLLDRVGMSISGVAPNPAGTVLPHTAVSAYIAGRNLEGCESMKSLPELIVLAEEVARQRIASTTLADIEQTSAAEHLCEEDRTRILAILHTRMRSRTTAPQQ